MFVDRILILLITLCLILGVINFFRIHHNLDYIYNHIKDTHQTHQNHETGSQCNQSHTLP